MLKTAFLGAGVLRRALPRASLSFSRLRSTLMKAAVMHQFGGPEVLKLKEIPAPEPEAGQVLVKVHAAGVNPVDTYIRNGEFAVLPKLPAILGKEVAGVVEEVGREVADFKVGDRVVCCLPCNGGYAEYVTCQPLHMFHLSDDLSFSQGAALYVAYFTAYRALVTLTKVQKGETILVHGASGAVGIAAVQLAKSKGLKVVGTAGSPEGMEVVNSVGADFVFNHKDKKCGLDSFASTDANGFDVIMECNAHLNLNKDLHLLNMRGRVAVVGSRGPVDINPRSLMYTEGYVVGVKILGATPEEFEETKRVICQGVKEGWVRPVIHKEYNLRFASKAHDEIINNSGARGKRVFVMS